MTSSSLLTGWDEGRGQMFGKLAASFSTPGVAMSLVLLKSNELNLVHSSLEVPLCVHVAL